MFGEPLFSFFRNTYTSHAKRIYLSVEMYGCFFKGLACGASFRQDGARKAVVVRNELLRIAL